ncbi:hypothetical protein STRIP9103_06787 [Streptomyces ipomoeae 91-03]|uniref:Uncharacterized protein n=1 Tax=Streptomyces ipomoeae 91-03 TaxID=698759 RepID=L1L168_9ACTN|nr:hypothetical protein STRIP9103_06787 [Streptomyces ipomoeae 91-03]
MVGNATRHRWVRAIRPPWQRLTVVVRRPHPSRSELSPSVTVSRPSHEPPSSSGMCRCQLLFGNG